MAGTHWNLLTNFRQWQVFLRRFTINGVLQCKYSSALHQEFFSAHQLNLRLHSWLYFIFLIQRLNFTEELFWFDQFSSVQFSPLTDWIVRGTWGTIQQRSFFQSLLYEALVNSSGMGRDGHSLMVSSRHFLCGSRRRPPSKAPWRVVLERVSRRVTYPKHASLIRYQHAKCFTGIPSNTIAYACFA